VKLAMSSYETTVTVESSGDIRVSGSPFRPGTQVDVTIAPAQNGVDVAGRSARLLAALDQAHNSEAIGPLGRAALYDRHNLH